MKKNYLLLSIIFFCSSQYFFAQTDLTKNKILTDRFILGAGIFLPNQNIKVAASGEIPTNNPEEGIKFDEVLGTGDYKSTMYLNFMWRFSKSKRWSLKAEYFKIDNSGTAVLKEDIEWDGLTFKAGSTVNAGVSLSLYKVFFGRAISTGNKHELGAGIGIHALDVGAYLQGKGYVNEGTYSLDRRKVSVIAPLPNIGIWYFYAPIEKLSFEARLDWFGITVGDYGGGLWNIEPGVNYQIFKNINLGASYKFFNLNVDVNKDSWKGNFNMAFSGPAFSIIGHF